MKVTHSLAVYRLAEVGIELIYEYKGSKELNSLRCITCGHEWQRTLSGTWTQGCPRCRARKIGDMFRMSHEEVSNRFLSHNVQMIDPYESAVTPVKTRCLGCLYEWSPRPQHIFNGSGCPRCAGVNTLSQSEALIRFEERGLKLLNAYVGTKTSVRLLCLKCSHVWTVKPNSIFNGQGCPSCASHGFNPGKPAILYYIKVTNPCGNPLYKIGITNRTVAKRFAGENLKIEILYVEIFQIGADAHSREKEILIKYATSLYYGPNILTSGNDELFIKDVLNLDCTEPLIMETF